MEFLEHVALAPFTTFGIGGPALWFARATTEADIVAAAAFARTHAVPIFPLGGGSNLLVSDAGFDGLVVHLALRGIDEQEESPKRIVSVAAGENWNALVTHTVDRGCAGMECLAGIPGTVGGTPVQNVGAYGQEVAQTIVRVRCFDLETQAFVEFEHEECGFAYRTSRFNTVDRGRYIVTRVDFALTPGAPPSLAYADVQKYFAGRAGLPTLSEVAEAVRAIRASKGMVLAPGDPDSRSAGSFFKNPVIAARHYERIAAEFAPARVPSYPAPVAPSGDAQVKLPAAWLLQQAGFHRGYTLGEAGISSKHTLALINRGQASAADIAALREVIVAGVQARFDIRLEPEPVWLGEPLHLA